jgi:hypothetical protein
MDVGVCCDSVAAQRVFRGVKNDDLIKKKPGELSSGDGWLFLDEQLATAAGAAENQ